MSLHAEPSLDPDRHASEVAALWADFRERCNCRVPMTFACDEQVWLKAAGGTFREFYERPDVHLRAQLEGRRWFIEHAIGDMDPRLPDRWNVGVQLWMEESEFFGCKTEYQEDDYAWAKPVPLPGADLLRHLRDLDPEERVRGSRAWRMYEALKELAAGRTFLDRPIDVVPCGGTHGIFTKAAEVRGIDRLCLDVVESPGFVDELLGVVTEKVVGRIRAWHELATGAELAVPSDDGWGLCDDSLQLISASAYERLVLPHHERLFRQMTRGARSIHLCGRAAQHFHALRWKLGITSIDGPGPFVDHGRYLAEFGPEFSFCAQTNHSILQRGSPEEIDAMMRDLLTPAAKQPGRFQLMAYVTRDTPPANVRAAYEAARRHGAIGATDRRDTIAG